MVAIQVFKQFKTEPAAVSSHQSTVSLAVSSSNSPHPYRSMTSPADQKHPLLNVVFIMSICSAAVVASSAAVESARITQAIPFASSAWTVPSCLQPAVARGPLSFLINKNCGLVAGDELELQQVRTGCICKLVKHVLGA